MSNQITISFNKEDIKQFKYVKDTDVANDNIIVFLENLDTDQAENSVDRVIWDLIHTAEKLDKEDGC